MSDSIPPDLRGTVPPPPPVSLPNPHQPAPPWLAAVLAEMQRQGQQVDKVVRLLAGDALDPTAPLGLVQRQNAQEAHLADLETRVTDLEDAGGKTAEKWGGRAWSMFYDAVKMAGAAGLGAWFTKGGNT